MKKKLATLLGLFGASPVIRRPGIVPRCRPHYATDVTLRDKLCSCEIRTALVGFPVGLEPYVEVWGVAQRRRCLRVILSLHAEMLVSPNATNEAV